MTESFACHSAACAPPPAGSGGSKGKSGGGRSVSSLQREIAGNKLSRAEMPQVPKAHVAAFMQYLKAKGIRTSKETVSPRSVTGTQNEINAKAVVSAAKAIQDGSFVPKRILVSSDNKVVDGHHQWAAQAMLGRKIDITRVHAGIDKILQTAHDFNKRVGIERKGIEDFAAMELACQSAACAPPPAGTGGSKPSGASSRPGSTGTPHVDDLFKGKPKIVAPFPSAGRRKGESKLPPREAIQKALSDIKLTQVDPKTLKTQQGFVTRAGVDYYMKDKYRKTGETYADPGDAGNRFPMVWKKPNGDNVILSGNHRFTAALIEGRTQAAIVVET